MNAKSGADIGAGNCGGPSPGPFAQWNDRYSVGAAAIDQQHRFLISILRDLQEAMAAGRATEVLCPLIHKLVTYTHYHFKYEEALYMKAGFSNLEQHQEAHRQLTDKVNELEKAAKSGNLRIGAPVAAFLVRWLICHIQGEDKNAFQQVLAVQKESPMFQQADPETQE